MCSINYQTVILHIKFSIMTSSQFMNEFCSLMKKSVPLWMFSVSSKQKIWSSNKMLLTEEFDPPKIKCFETHNIKKTMCLFNDAMFRWRIPK